MVSFRSPLSPARRAPRAARIAVPATCVALAATLACAPAAGAQSLGATNPDGPQAPGVLSGSLAATPPSLPGIESAPVQLPAFADDLPVVAVPVLAPGRPTPEYAQVGIFPNDGETVGVAQPVMFTFDRPITDRARAEKTLEVRTAPSLPGKFYWISDTEVRWRPLGFYPPNTSVTVYAGGRQQTFKTGDAVVTTYDDATKTMTTTRNGEVVRTMRASTGRAAYPTNPGTYYTGWRAHQVRMDSSTWGLAQDAGGYDTTVDDGVRLSYDGIFVHSAPWSIADQGVRNVTHGCINLSPEDAAWFYANTENGDPVVVNGTAGAPLGPEDGQADWNY